MIKVRSSFAHILGVMAGIGFASLACAERILLVPIDSRPASGQFAQMIANISDADVVQPPVELLGQFTRAGAPERIISWLNAQDIASYDAVILSTDMIAYGGLIASRQNQASYESALRRIKAVAKLREENPSVRFYAFSSITRLSPTATRDNASWRASLGRFAEVRERYRLTKDRAARISMNNLRGMIPSAEIDRYDAIRARNHEVQQALLRLTKYGAFDYLILGQDDAQPMGPHITENAKLRKTVGQLGISSKVYFAEGIDQQPNVLVSRALLSARGWMPRVRLVWSDDAGKRKVALYESKTIESCLRDQLTASGAKPVLQYGDYDYTLYLNSPEPNRIPFLRFLASLAADIDQGKPVAVADIDLGHDGTGNPELFDFLREKNRMTRLASYAGWNTAGNTIGTAIPAANVYLFAKRFGTDAYRREVAQREFLLHRFVNDFQYHKFTRPYAYRMLDASSRASREETYGDDFEDVNTFVRQDLGRHLDETFKEQFLGRLIMASGEEYALQGLDHVRIYLPWPRAYEVRLEFQMTTRPVVAMQTATVMALAKSKL